MKKFGIKEVVATGIGTALFVVLTQVQIPLGFIPNTSLQPRAAVLAFLAAVFGPVVGGIVGLLGHALGDAMFYGSGAGKLPTASAVVADVVDMVKHQHTNIYIDWSSEKLEVVDYKDSVNSFFVRTTSDKATVEASFGKVSYVEGVEAGEMGFTTGDMTEAEFEEKSAKIELVNRVRLG